MYQHDNGLIGLWYMDGTTLISPTLFTPNHPGDANWRIVGTGDFNQDGQTDLLWQYSSPGAYHDGQLAVWYMNGIALDTPTLLNPPFPDTFTWPENKKWRVVATGDYNGDGQVDILFQYKNPGGGSDGNLELWTMNGVNRLAKTPLTPAHPGAGWAIVGPK